MQGWRRLFRGLMRDVRGCTTLGLRDVVKELGSSMSFIWQTTVLDQCLDFRVEGNTWMQEI